MPAHNADDASAADIDFDALPPEARAQLHAGLLDFLREVGIAPRVHRVTGELMVPLHEMCSAMGLSPDEVRQAIGHDPGCLETGDPDDLVPLQ